MHPQQPNSYAKSRDHACGSFRNRQDLSCPATTAQPTDMVLTKHVPSLLFHIVYQVMALARCPQGTRGSEGASNFTTVSPWAGYCSEPILVKSPIEQRPFVKHNDDKRNSRSSRGSSRTMALLRLFLPSSHFLSLLSFLGNCGDGWAFHFYRNCPIWSGRVPNASHPIS